MNISIIFFSSDGVIYDFAGSETIGEDELAFGEAHKYVYLNPNEREMQDWDKSIMLSNRRFCREEHNIFT